MPHRVTHFFRTSTGSLENQAVNIKNATTRRRDSSSRTERPSGSSERVYSYAISTGDEVVDESAPPLYCQLAPPARAMNNLKSPRTASFSSDSAAKDHHHHRLSFPGLHLKGKEKAKEKEKDVQHTPASTAHASLRWRLESPPAVFYGDADNSSGALVSGLLFLDVTQEAGIDVESFKASMSIRVTQKKPFTQHCNDCAHQSTELKSWNFLERPILKAKGEHGFPFSILLEGHLPASMDSQIASISYVFKAELIPRSKGSASPTIKLEKILDVKRSLPIPDVPHHSVRVFPPTNIKASVFYPQVIHPIGSQTLQLRIDGISRTNAGVSTVEYWRLKKLTWRLEETIKTVAPACHKHDQAAAANARKGIQRLDTRVIGGATLTNGWKSDYTSLSDSHIEMEIEYQPSAPPTSSGQAGLRPSGDLKARDGTEVSHQLMLEMVVSEEWAPLNRPTLFTQTGTGRILRMHFAQILTDRAGIGISWDNEAPPIYQDVPPSPPAYVGEARISVDDFRDGVPAIDGQLEMLDGGRALSPVAGSSSATPLSANSQS